MLNHHNFINWTDTRLHKDEVDHFFYNLIDMVNEIKDNHPQYMKKIIKKYGVFEYSLEYEDYAPRIGFSDDT